MKETITVMTIQNKEVYDNLILGNIHRARKEEFFSDVSPLTYQYGLDLINNQIDGDLVVSPVFFWHSLENNFLSKDISENDLLEVATLANELTGFADGDVLILLTIPLDELVITNFNVYAECLYLEEVENSIPPLEDIQIEIDQARGDSIQVLGKWIKPEWIIKSYLIENNLETYDFKLKRM